MIVEISPMAYTIGFAFAFALCGFMISRGIYRKHQDDVVESTIIYLVDNNFVKAKSVNGELEIIPLSEE